MLLEVRLDISLDGVANRRGYDRDTEALTTLPLHLIAGYVCLVCENPSSSTLMICVILCMYVMCKYPD